MAGVVLFYENRKGVGAIQLSKLCAGIAVAYNVIRLFL